MLTAAQYAEVFDFRRHLRGRWFALHYRPNGQGQARLGLVIAKRYARAAVLRNAIKRQAREAFRHVRPGLPAVDVILRLNMQANPSRLPGLAQRAEMRATWRKEIESLLSRIPRPDSHGTMEQAS